MPTTTYIPLANVTVGVAGASSITFSSISQSYRDLILVSKITTNGFAKTLVRVNGSTASAYSWVTASGRTTAGVQSLTQSGTFGGISPENYSNSGDYMTAITHFFDYSTTDKHKTWLTRSDSNASGGYSGAEMACNRWASTSAITSIQIYPDSGSFNEGASFALYGVVA